MSELPLRGHATTECPFAFCMATPDIAREQRHAGPSGGEVRRIKIHEIENTDFPWLAGDPCPASLMVIPLNEAGHAALIEYARITKRAIHRRLDDEDRQDERLRQAGTPRSGSDPAAGPGGDRIPGRHSREPRETGSSWMRPNPGSSSRHHPPLRGHERWHPADYEGEQ